MTSKDHSRLLQVRSSDLSDEEDPNDYLQDPDLWTDRLPQPFRMLDNLLQRVLYRAWDEIEHRETERIREAARIKIPEVFEWSRVPAVDECALGSGLHVLACGEDGYVFVGGSRGFAVLKAPGEDNDFRKIAQSGNLEADLINLNIAANKGVHFIAVVCHKEVKIFALIEDNLISVCSISPPSEEHHVVAGQFSPTASHIGVTMSHPDSGNQLDFHKLPLDSWHTQLSQYLKKLEEAAMLSEEGEGNKTTTPEEMVYSKPAVLCRLHPPKGLHPCPTDDPAEAYQRVMEGMKNHIATGDLHVFTQTYFENRKKAFLSKHPHLADTYDMEVSYSKSLPTFHYIYYKDTYRLAEPSYVVVWWESHNQLFVYPLPSEVSKNPVSVDIHWLLPQASPVLCSAVSPDTKLLAVAQGTGFVTVWNFQTHFCESVSAIARDPDQVTSVEFFNDGGLIVAGTEQGHVKAIGTEDDREDPPFSLSQRVEERGVYSDISKSSGYDSESQVTGLRVNSVLPSVVSSVHIDGSVILRSSTDRQAICKLCLPPSVNPKQCSYTADGKRLLTITGPGLISVDLTSAAISPLLTKHLRKDDKKFSLEDEVSTPNFMQIIENQLNEYIRYRRDHHEADSIRWAKRWEEMGLELKNATSLS